MNEQTAQNTQINEQNTQKMEEKRVVTLDIPFETVLKWDKSGDKLIFEVERFKILTDAEVLQLSKRSSDRYHISKDLCDERKKDEALGVPTSTYVEFATSLGSASARLRVLNKDPFMEYRSVRTDKVEERLAEGWIIVKDGPERTLNRNASGIHTVGSMGHEEFVLMKIPKERYQQIHEMKRE